MDALARQLVACAEVEAASVPTGAFMVPLPEGVPLRTWAMGA